MALFLYVIFIIDKIKVELKISILNNLITHYEFNSTLNSQPLTLLNMALYGTVSELRVES